MLCAHSIGKDAQQLKRCRTAKLLMGGLASAPHKTRVKVSDDQLAHMCLEHDRSAGTNSTTRLRFMRGQVKHLDTLM